MHPIKDWYLTAREILYVPSEGFEQMDNSIPNSRWTDKQWDDYMATKEKSYTDIPLREITKEEFEEMLCVLPPRNWENRDGVNRFLMSEFMDGAITSQYINWHGKYFHKYVNAFDRSTWVTDRQCADCLFVKSVLEREHGRAMFQLMMEAIH